MGKVRIVGGIDEAGRGSMVGPLVVAGISFLESLLPELRRIGVKDSKLLTRKRREELEKRIRALATSLIIKVVPSETVDKYVEGKRDLGGLNKLEEEVFAEIATKLGADVLYVDVPDVNVERFVSRLKRRIGSVEVYGSHKAEEAFIVTAAASIVAKVARDREIEKIKREVGELGSGYPSDKRTLRFVERWVVEHGSLPPFVRRSWKPAATLLRRLEGCRRK